METELSKDKYLRETQNVSLFQEKPHKTTSPGIESHFFQF